MALVAYVIFKNDLIVVDIRLSLELMKKSITFHYN